MPDSKRDLHAPEHSVEAITYILTFQAQGKYTQVHVRKA